MATKQVFNTSAELDYPTVLPTLDLDFANSKTLDPRITFTRASGGSYVGADGLIKYAGVNEARFDHDPETGESLGLLIEEARTNLLLRSEEFNLWAKTRSTIQPNVITAPDGTNTADKLVEDTTPNNNHIVFRSSLGLSSNVYTFSVYVKAAERNEIVLRIDTNVTQRNVRFNLVEGTIVNAGDVSARIEYVGNGWYRCINTMNIAEEVTNAVLMLADSRFPLSVVYTGDGTSGIYIWGAQLEEGAFPTSYIPTQASTRTRAYEYAAVEGDNFLSSIPNTRQFSHYTSWSTDVDLIPAGGSVSAVIDFSNSFNSFENRYNILHPEGTGSTFSTRAFANNNALFVNTSRNYPISDLEKIAFRMDLSNITDVNSRSWTIFTRSNKITPVRSIAATVEPTIKRLGIGSYSKYTNISAGRKHYKRIMNWPFLLSDSQLQALTS
jgi:hypothetical protein